MAAPGDRGHDEILARVSDGFDLGAAYADTELVAHVQSALERSHRCIAP